MTRWMARRLGIAAVAAVVAAVGLTAVAIVPVLDGRARLLFESAESKTTEDGPVFNEIRWLRQGSRDIWMMNQSHHGAEASPEKWERLAIVVDNSKHPRTARFYQFAPGPLEWSEGLEESPFRVSCFMCHSNGPRAVRPKSSSWGDRITVALWNLRVKTYGRVVAHPEHEASDKYRRPPFRWRGGFENEPLKVGVCVRCHRGDGWLSRGTLTRQNFPTIQFMVGNGHMPPLGFSISPSERAQLRAFLEGL